MRFILQATPIVAITLGSFLGLSWAYASGWISRELKFNLPVTKVLVFLLLALLLIQPMKDGYSQAFHSAPSMNDAWYNTLSKIRNEAPKDIVITSWWDFGHWFKAVADRPVTFDGGTQTNWGAYWVGKSLLTDDEKNSVGIVRMLNCGQNEAFKELNKIIADVPETIELLNIIVAQDKGGEGRSLGAGDLERSQRNPMIFERDRGHSPGRGVFCLILFDECFFCFDGLLHPIQCRLGGESESILPIRQAEDFFVQPDIHRAFDEAVCHGDNSISLCA